MGQKITVATICDLEHPGETDAVTAIQFELNGTAYEIDACMAHSEAFQAAIGPWTDVARKSAGRFRAPRQPGAAPRVQRRRTPEARADRARIRSWAAARYAETSDPRYICSERGRLSTAVAALYHKETGTGPS